MLVIQMSTVPFILIHRVCTVYPNTPNRSVKMTLWELHYFHLMRSTDFFIINRTNWLQK